MAITGLASAVSAAPLWTVERSEIAHLFYGEIGKPLLSISCGQAGETGRDETRIEVEVENGTKPGKDPVVLRIEQDKGHKDVPLKPLICGGLSECKNQPGGEVYRYETATPGKSLALDTGLPSALAFGSATGAWMAANSLAAAINMSGSLAERR